MIHIIPAGTISAEATSILARSEVPVITDGNLGAKLAKTIGVAISFIQVTEDELSLITRAASALLNDTVTVVTATPGLVYPGPWMMVGSRIHSIDWLVVEASLTKAGFTANANDTLSKRAVTDDKLGAAVKSTTSFFNDDDESEAEVDPLGFEGNE